jgi:hypothetical protein
MIGIRKKKDSEAEEDISKRNQPHSSAFDRHTLSTDYLALYSVATLVFETANTSSGLDGNDCPIASPAAQSDP